MIIGSSFSNKTLLISPITSFERMFLVVYTGTFGNAAATAFPKNLIFFFTKI